MGAAPRSRRNRGPLLLIAAVIALNLLVTTGTVSAAVNRTTASPGLWGVELAGTASARFDAAAAKRLHAHRVGLIVVDGDHVSPSAVAHIRSIATANHLSVLTFSTRRAAVGSCPSGLRAPCTFIARSPAAALQLAASVPVRVVVRTHSAADVRKLAKLRHGRIVAIADLPRRSGQAAWLGAAKLVTANPRVALAVHVAGPTASGSLTSYFGLLSQTAKTSTKKTSGTSVPRTPASADPGRTDRAGHGWALEHVDLAFVAERPGAGGFLRRLCRRSARRNDRNAVVHGHGPRLRFESSVRGRFSLADRRRVSACGRLRFDDRVPWWRRWRRWQRRRPAPQHSAHRQQHGRHDDHDHGQLARVDGQRRRHRLHGLSRRSERRDDRSHDVHLFGTHVRNVVHPRGRRLRRRKQPFGPGSLTTSTSACVAPGDTTAPTAPTGLTKTAATVSSVSLSWTASTDNVGVAGYSLTRNGVAAGTTATRTTTFTGLACGTTYTLGVAAYDAAGNTSSRTTLSAATSACAPAGDTQAPTAPSGLAVNSATQTSLSLSWSASTDNVGVTGYGLYGAGSGTVAATSTSVAGLACGTSYTVQVDAFDAAGNHSAKASVTASTLACSGGGGGGTASVYVSTSGSDSTCVRGDSTKPCASFNKAFQIAASGDVVEVAGGAYSGQSISQSSKTAAVTIRPASGATVTVASTECQRQPPPCRGNRRRRLRPVERRPERL